MIFISPKGAVLNLQGCKSDCESGNNRHIVEQIKNNCKLHKNKNLPYLERVEGGMGGNNNRTDKQIRFRDYRL